MFENLRNVFLEIYEIDPAHFLPAPGLAWQACLKKTKINLELLTDIDMLLMIEAGIRGAMCQSIYRFAKTNNKYMKNYNKDIILSYLMHLGAKNLHGWAISQKLSVNGFKWVRNLSECNSIQFNEDFIKKYDENSYMRHFLQADIDYPEKLFNLHRDLPFLPKRKKVNKVEKLICSIVDKEKYVIH